MSKQKFGWLHLAVVLNALFGIQFSSQAADYSLGAGDIIKITVFDYPDLTTETRVTDSGVITFPLIGEVSVGGKTPAEAENLIEKNLSAQGFIRHPNVSIVVSQFVSQQVSIIGLVNKPGKYSLEKASSLSEVLAMAGGLHPDGDEKAVLVRQGGEGEKKNLKVEIDLHGLFNGDLTKDVPILAGDMIFVPKAQVFFIYGEVQKPGMYRLERNLNVAQAIAVGGGLTPRGTDHWVKLKRKNSVGEMESDTIELGDQVHADDVIYVRESWF